MVRDHGDGYEELGYKQLLAECRRLRTLMRRDGWLFFHDGQCAKVNEPMSKYCIKCGQDMFPGVVSPEQKENLNGVLGDD